ncbi:MAG: hypothetical protein ORN21_06860 [Methylophilaceae bacterium]|nr:hypothetical protein [Methylophilaceae bacterium]
MFKTFLIKNHRKRLKFVCWLIVAGALAVSYFYLEKEREKMKKQEISRVTGEAYARVAKQAQVLKFEPPKDPLVEEDASVATMKAEEEQIKAWHQLTPEQQQSAMSITSMRKESADK